MTRPCQPLTLRPLTTISPLLSIFHSLGELMFLHSIGESLSLDLLSQCTLWLMGTSSPLPRRLIVVVVERRRSPAVAEAFPALTQYVQ